MGFTSLRGPFARSNPVELPLRIRSFALCIFSGLLRLRLAMTDYRFHVIARALRPKQSSRIASSNTIIFLCIFSGLLRLRLAMTDYRFHVIARALRPKQSSRITSSNTIICVVYFFWIASPAACNDGLSVSPHFEGPSPEAIQ